MLLYLQSVGGFDAHYFKEDIADGIAFSLDLWLCGASIKQVSHISMSSLYLPIPRPPCFHQPSAPWVRYTASRLHTILVTIRASFLVLCK